jgi:hypothetical protein
MITRIAITALLIGITSAAAYLLPDQLARKLAFTALFIAVFALRFRRGS